jgi:hypothetical protein
MFYKLGLSTADGAITGERATILGLGVFVNRTDFIDALLGQDITAITLTTEALQKFLVEHKAVAADVSWDFRAQWRVFHKVRLDDMQCCHCAQPEEHMICGEVKPLKKLTFETAYALVLGMLELEDELERSVLLRVQLSV